ncbi:MAG: hypothetical protein O3A46_05265 [Candidatus Poribacteria bacterium]|nr:hypothetical protein [Candidatus Poribacteria bacterium]
MPPLPLFDMLWAATQYDGAANRYGVVTTDNLPRTGLFESPEDADNGEHDW